MIRATNSVTQKARHKKWLKRASGYWGRSSTCYRIARERVERGWQHAYVHRKEFRRNIRQLWIARLNAAVREIVPGEKMEAITYSRFIYGINKLGIVLNRKIMSEMSITAKDNFNEIVQQVISYLKSENNSAIKIREHIPYAA